MKFANGTAVSGEQAVALITVLSDRNATVARVKSAGYTATGSSKRNNGEHYDAQVGTTLAVARALKNLARELEKSVNV